MELNFDKEMDALLRKARSGTSVAAPKGGHLDADAIAAFAEGAIPDALRRTYTAHFADCNECRKALSYVALLNAPLSMEAVAAPVPRAAAPWPPNAVPWYRSLFRTPGLAAAMGLLVLAFGAGLVYLVTQRGANTSSTVAMDQNKPAASSAPYTGIDANSNANATATISDASSSNAANNTVAKSATNSSSNSTTTKTATNEPDASATGYAGGTAPSGTATVQQPVAAAPPADSVAGRDTGGKPTEDKPKTSTEARKDRDEDQKETARSRALSDDGLARGEIMTRKAVGGPQRSGPVQNQVQNNVANGEMPVTRKVGGKTFHNSGGAWYDSAYHGQSTTNVHRGTDDFKKLDGSLRSVANDLGGVVVVVWKDKAYRIQ